MAVVTQDQRALLDAVDALERVDNHSIADRLDSIIEELTALVGRMGEGVRGAAPDAASAAQTLADEGMTRGVAQRNADRCP